MEVQDGAIEAIFSCFPGFIEDSFLTGVQAMEMTVHSKSKIERLKLLLILKNFI